MTNIFNKKILVKNGTLIGNWYEEEVLRNATGEGRSLSKNHIAKNFMNFNKEIINPWPVENTSARILGQKNYCSFSTSTGDIGNFDNITEKYKTKGKNEENFKQIFHTQKQLENEKNNSDEIRLKSIRLFNTSNKNQYIPQPLDYNNIGRRLMKTQDSKEIPNEKIDKNFMALHQMSKFPSIISDGEVNQYMDRTVPYYKDKEITFWSTNLKKGNVYRSFLKGENSFAKSSGFTQPIQNTKSVEQFTGNVTNNHTIGSVMLNDEHTKFIEKYNESIIKKNQPLDLTESVKNKLSIKFYESWITLRKLRNYLKNLNRKSKNSDLIDSTDFKFHLVKFGIFFEDLEIKFIFQKFDKYKNNLINFNEFLDFFTECSEERLNLIKRFYDQVKCKQKNYALFKNLELLLNPELHPEVIQLKKSGEEVKHEFLTLWQNLKEDNLITEDNFLKYHMDISSCIEVDQDFVKCLNALGFKN